MLDLLCLLKGLLSFLNSHENYLIHTSETKNGVDVFFLEKRSNVYLLITLKFRITKYFKKEGTNTGPILNKKKETSSLTHMRSDQNPYLKTTR